MSERAFVAGQKLRKVREQMGLLLRDVEAASGEIARKYENSEYSIIVSRLSEIETKGIQPTIYRLYSLAAIYRIDVREILSWYGIDIRRAPEEGASLTVTKTHKFSTPEPEFAEVPIAVDPAFDLNKTANLARMIMDWGIMPITELRRIATKDFTYVRIGSEDFTMYPLLPPGSIVQVDEQQTKLEAGPWGSEFERPMYLIECREALICSWCALDEARNLQILPHPLSPVRARTMKYPQDAEIVGRVVSAFRRLQEVRPTEKASLPSTANASHSHRVN
jgi:transcriptional regulator with XRE-family HTH domain